MDWQISEEPVKYEDALTRMEKRAHDIHNLGADEMVWLLEHPPLYTAGTSAKERDLLNPRFPVFTTGRGGQYTYHGPGQRVAYVMLNLKKRQQEPDIKHYIWQLEEWIIRTLARFDVYGMRREGRVGIWVCDDHGRESKIAAVGVRVRHWVSFHGIAINLDPDLSHFSGIVPCGITGYGVTSLRDLGSNVRMQDLDAALGRSWGEVFDIRETSGQSSC